MMTIEQFNHLMKVNGDSMTLEEKDRLLARCIREDTTHIEISRQISEEARKVAEKLSSFSRIGPSEETLAAISANSARASELSRKVAATCANVKRTVERTKAIQAKSRT